MINSKKTNIIVLIAVIIAFTYSVFLVKKANDADVQANEKTTPLYATEIFGADIISVEILADEKTWQEMIDNATNEEYTKVDVIVNGTRFNEVGIRPKGNSSLTQVAMDDTTDRYSFRLKFDEYIKGQTCFGLDTFVLNNILGDNTYMKEYTSYDIMKEIGMDTPYFGYADIKLNGEEWGLYLAVEMYRDSYEQRVFGDTSGRLYNVKNAGMDGDEVNGGGMGEMGANNPMAENGNGGVQNQTNENGVVSVPEGNTPEVNGSAGNVPAGDVPEASGSAGNVPAGDVPVGNAPEVSGSAGNIPAGDIPAGNTPEVSVSAGNVPAGDVPVGNNPEVSGSTGNVPAGNTPEGNVPEGNRPGGMGMGGNNGGSLVYTDDNSSSYSDIFDNATDASTEQDSKRVIEALKALSEGKDIEKYFDVDEILRYLAAHTVVVNLDSYSSMMAQNYYLYERDGVIDILPWDYSLAWGGFQSGSASDVVNFPIDTPVSGVEMADRPLIDKLFENEEYLERYHTYLQEILDGYFANGAFQAKVDELDNLISDSVKADTTKFCTYEEYEKSLETFKKLGELRAESIQGQLDKTVPSTTQGQEANPEKLISADEVNLDDLGSMGGNGGGKMNPFGENVDMEVMKQAMDIIRGSGGELTEESKQQLLDLGLTEEEIEQFKEMGNRGGPAPNGNGNQSQAVESSSSDYVSIGILLIILAGVTAVVAKFKRKY